MSEVSLARRSASDQDVPLATPAPIRTRRDWQTQLAIFGGGAVGALARALVGVAFPVGEEAWPWPVFLINVVGALLLGYFATRLQERLPPTTYRRPLLGTGFCGALTTFSTLQVELVRLVEHDHLASALSYTAASVAAGFAGVFASTALTRRARVSR
jgi:CrcB protein